MPEFDIFSLLEFQKRTARAHGIKKNGNCKRKRRIQKLANCNLRDLAAKIDVYGQHCMFSNLSSLPISNLLSLDTEAYYFNDRTARLYDASLLTKCYTQHALRPAIDSKINHIRHFIKIPFIKKGMNFVDLPSISEINRYNHPFQTISRIVKYQSFVVNIINLLGALYLISEHLCLISKLVLLTLETARTLNMFIRLRVMLLRAI